MIAGVAPLRVGAILREEHDAMRRTGPLFALLVTLSLAPVGTAAAAPRDSRGCVTPKATPDRVTHHLRRTWVFVYTKPSTSATTMSYTIASPFPLWIVGESGSFYRVASGDSMDEWPFKPQTTLGWVRKSDVQDQGIRNCT